MAEEKLPESDWTMIHGRFCLVNELSGFTVYWKLPSSYHLTPFLIAVTSDQFGFGFGAARFSHSVKSDDQKSKIIITSGRQLIDEDPNEWNDFRRTVLSSNRNFRSRSQQDRYISALKSASPHIPIKFGGGPSLGYGIDFSEEVRMKIDRGDFVE